LQPQAISGSVSRMPDFTRRSLLLLTPLSLRPFSGLRVLDSSSSSQRSFPFQDRDLVREVVGASHGSLARVKELVTAMPALARASWDWGFGDHEAAIDAASHMGNRPIAEFLIANGARPTIFTMAMLGRLDVVKGMVDALPGVQQTRGPHGITLLAHAKVGGAEAAGVVSYLEQLGDADPRYPNLPLSESELAALTGDYAIENGSLKFKGQQYTLAGSFTWDETTGIASSLVMTMQLGGRNDPVTWKNDGNLTFAFKAGNVSNLTGNITSGGNVYKIDISFTPSDIRKRESPGTITSTLTPVKGGASVKDTGSGTLGIFSTFDGSMDTDVTPVPEPATLLLFASGALTLAGLHRTGSRAQN